MNDQAKRITGIAVACAFSAALSLVGASHEAAAAKATRRSAMASPKRARTAAMPGQVRPAPAPRRSITRAIPGRSCRRAPASPSRFPATAKAASRRSNATSRRLSHTCRVLAKPWIIRFRLAPAWPQAGALSRDPRPSPDIGWFEIHAENYMGAGGPPHHHSAPSASATRCRCMASACRSAARGRSTANISRG